MKKVAVNSLNARTNHKEQTATINLVVEISSTEELDKLRKTLKSLDGVKDVFRVKT